MKLAPALAEALRLTRAGDLDAATAALRNMLAGSRNDAAATMFDLKPVAGLRREATLTRHSGVPQGDVAQRRNPATSHAARLATATQLGSGLRRNDEDGRAGTDEHARTFLKRRVETPEGGLDYRLYVPTGAAAGLPLVVMLHGCTQSPEDFARGTAMNRLADERGFLVAYPGQSTHANAQKCWNWFKSGDQARGAGEPALIAALTREVIAAHRCDPARVYVAGLSAGGAAAAIMAAAYPDVFAAAGIHSGLASGAASDLPGALAAMKTGIPKRRVTGAFVPVITFHGDADATVAEVNARQIVAAATRAAGGALATTTDAGVSAGGRRYTRATSRDAGGRPLIEQWTLHGAGHAWSGGDVSGSYTDPAGPDASRAMLDFFQGHRLGNG